MSVKLMDNVVCNELPAFFSVILQIYFLQCRLIKNKCENIHI